MSIADRLKMVHDIWDSIANDATNLEISDAEIAFLDAQIAAYESEKTCVPWESIKLRLVKNG